MNPRLRRNACPTIAVPMETGDGLLARLPPTGPLAASTVLAIADAARRFGNGIVEVTARGSIQVRGLTATSAGPFKAALAAAGIDDASPAIVAPPLAGLDPGEVTDVRPLAGELRAALDADGIGARLAPKTSVVIDGGGRLHLDAIDADLRLVATGHETFTVSVGGTAATARAAGSITVDSAAAAALAVLRLIAGLGPTVRGRDLDAKAAATALDAGPASPATRRSAAEPLGVHVLADGTRAVGLGLAFGQIEAATLAELAGVGEDLGATAFVPTEGRALLALGLAPDAVARFRERAAMLGFIVSADDPRRAIVACPGAPACASGLMPARAVATAVASAAAPLLDGTATLHLSGCAKGCAHPRAATLTFVGGERGAGLVVAGRASDCASATVPAGDLPAAVARLASKVRGARSAHERAADTIARLGTRGLIAAMRDTYSYIRDGADIYARSFAIIREEADLARFAPDEAEVAVRMIHAAGMVELAPQIVFGKGVVRAARSALAAGAPILCDAEMVAHGVTRARLPAGNDVVCTLHDPRVADLAARLGTTRSAAALELWVDRMAGAVVAIGNAPTALFRLLELLADGAPPPAAIVGAPVGFVGAAESKDALIAEAPAPFLTVRGRLGGSAVTAAALNALAREEQS